MTSRMYDIFARMLQVLTAFPSVTRRGLVALFNLTGRLWWLVHDASQWYALFGFGTATLYVSTTGTDSPEKGTGTGTNAFRTIQYAVNQIPATLFGSVTLNIGAGTFREQVTVRGKALAGNYTIDFVGAITDDVASTTATAGANPVGNGTAGYGTLTKAGAGWTVNAFVNKLVEIAGGTGSGQVRLIHANTATVLTITGRWDTPPDATSTFRIFSQATRVTGADAVADTTPVRDTVFDLTSGQRGISLNYLRVDYGVTANVRLSEGARGTLVGLLSIGSTYGIYCTTQAGGSVNLCAIQTPSAAGIAIELTASLEAVQRSRITNSTVHGLYVLTGGGCYCWETFIGSCGELGISAENQGRVFVDGYLEVDSSVSDNLRTNQNATLVANFAYGGLTTIVSRGSGAWGWRAFNGGFNGNASGITYAANTSGTYTPTTAPDAGST